MSYGRLEQSDGRWQLRFTRRLAHPPERVWRALVDPEELDAWFPTTIEGECAPGAPLRFRFRKGEEVDEPAADRWQQVHEHYVQRFGSDA